ncbi:MAG: hypothetical protein AAGE52_09380 [Myxococcota bacterium]
MTYRDQISKIDDLESHEQLALGGLLRVLIRLDGQFSEEEEAFLEEAAAEIGGRDALWRVISRSAQKCPDDDSIRAHAQKVIRPEARLMIRETIEIVAKADTITEGEQKLLDWVAELWG